MKIKTQDLIGPALDWAVRKIERLEIAPRIEVVTSVARGRHCRVIDDVHYNSRGREYFTYYSPSTDWSQGGPIIDREDINLMHAEPGSMNDQAGIQCTAHKNGLYSDGITPLIAAMRCFVASKLGDEVDIPEVLL